MATEPTTEYNLPKDSYVAFDAISLRNLIIERLNDQKTFTDQNYIGSNIASVIDIISYAYNTLIFYLNKTSNESMFTEAQVYENINRIVKLLDYKPVGYQTSTLVFEVSAFSKLETDLTYVATRDLAPNRSYTIPRYSYLMVGGVPFSFDEDITFNVTSAGTQSLFDLTNKKLLFQGIYKEAPLYIAQGDASEMIAINSSSSIDHSHIDVYVYEQNLETWIQYKNVPNLYTERSFARTFEKRLNSNGTYDLLFGDGVNGRRLNAGDQVIVYYLESFEQRGVVEPEVLKQATKTVYTTTKFQEILNDVNAQNYTYLTTSLFNNLTFNNVVGSTVPKEIETADSIRKNAPSNFKSQYRLVTKEDFETFIKINFAGFISDVKVFSNWDYTGKYLKYFHDVLISPTAFKQIALNQVLYSDSCNFNNVYICATPRVSPGSSLKYLLPAQKEAILSNISSLKTLTTEIVFMDPVYKALSLGIKTNDEIFSILDKEFCRLQIIKTPTSRRSSKSIANDVKTVFENFFNPTITKLGGQILYSDLVGKILSVDGVSSIKSVRIDTNETFNGLALFMWNPVYPDIDKAIIVNDVALQDFEYIFFDELEKIFSKIDIIEPNSYTT
jgi:hypothetical protein